MSEEKSEKTEKKESKKKKEKKRSDIRMVLIILGLVVLLFLITGFSQGWDKIFPWLEEESNFELIVNECNNACNIKDVTSFCSMTREVKGEIIEDGGYTCEELIDENIGVNSCDICIKPGEKEYIWVIGEHNCLDKSKNQDLVDKKNCDSATQPLKGVCCEQDRQI